MSFILEAMARILGGDWELKNRALRATSRLGRAFYIAYWNYLMHSHGSSIGWNTVFRGKPVFPHGIKSVFISGDADIGSDCVIFQQVTIGSNYLPGSRRLGAPRIGDRCFIGAGAKLIGGIDIGDDVTIGAGSVVIDDVPSDSLVVGEKTRVIRREHRDNHYYTRTGGKWQFYADGKWHFEKRSEVIDELERARNRATA